jgi:hypothetical protein
MPSGKCTAQNLDSLNTTVKIQTFLPFSVFGLSSDDLSLYGINNFSIKANLKPDWLQRILLLKEILFFY